ncbi:MAG: MFS transporter [Chloroflexi bacterium]|nr:MFS transporter [Chloroflexota bacterium]
METFRVSILILYGVELLDELIYGLQGAILPYLRDDLALSYTEVGLLFTIPGLVSIVGEPFMGLLADTRHRRTLVVSGIVATAIGLFLTGIGQTFWLILFAFTILYIASGAYVTLSQATLIDRDPSRAEQTMARWTLLGSIGVAIAPLLVTALFYLGYGWRGLYLSLAGVAGFYTFLLLRQRFDQHAGAEKLVAPRELWNNLIAALRSRELIRWIVITELADLMLDKLLEVTGLYFHDVVGVDLGAASGAVAVSTTAGLVGNFLLVPALEKVSSLRVLRISAIVVLIAFIAFMLVPIVWLKFVLIGVIAFATTGWYPILRGKTYAALPGQSGVIVSVTALGNVSSVFVPVIVGRLADMFGLEWAMWIFLLGPISLIVGLPKESGTLTNAD